MQLDTSTLLVVLVLGNALMAVALWVALAGAFRAGLRLWAAALIAQSLAWLMLLAPYHASNLLSPLACGPTPVIHPMPGGGLMLFCLRRRSRQRRVSGPDRPANHVDHDRKRYDAGEPQAHKPRGALEPRCAL